MTWSRESRQSRGYGAAWDRTRARVLRRDDYLCQPCLRMHGRPTPASQVDHIRPKAKGGTDDDANLQSICRACHDEKTLRDKGARPRQRVGVDGFPVEP